MASRLKPLLTRGARCQMLERLGENIESLEETQPHDWDFVGACFFCFTAATTIGYGNYTPQTDAGASVTMHAGLGRVVAVSDRHSPFTKRALVLLVFASLQ